MADPDADVPGLLAPQRVAIGIMGPCFVGWYVMSILAGVCLSAFYHHLRRGNLSKDPLVIKFITIAVFVLNTTIGIVCGISIFHWGTTQNRTALDLWTQDVLDCVLPAFAGMVAFLVQAYYCRRSSLLFGKSIHKYIFTSVVGLLMLTAFAASLGITYYNFLQSAGIPAWRKTNEVWLWCSCAVDFINTATLCYLLKTKVVGFNERTDSVLKGLIRLGLETASYTTFVAIAAAIVLVTTDPNSYYVGDTTFALWIPLPGLYSLSLFTTLGSRDRVAKELSLPPLVTEESVNFNVLSRSHQDSSLSPRSMVSPLMKQPPRFSTGPTASFVSVSVDVAVTEDRDLEDESDWRPSRKSHRSSGRMEV